MKYLSLLGMLLLVFFSCRKDIDDEGSSSIMTSPPIIIDQYDPNEDLVDGSIYGKVTDENENPVADAIIKYNGKTFSSDEEGRFFILDELLDREGTFFTVEADGYFKGSRRIYPKDGSVNYAYVQLLELNNIGSFNAGDGGSVSGNDNIDITFTANSISSSTGNLYNGQVSVAAKWLDPTASNIGEIMPGSLLGLDARVEEVSLVSYGMMAVELFDENGNNLNIADGNTATLSFPVPQSLLDDAPAEIPLWSFEDAQYGIWAEEGKATLQGDKYVGQVSHFSFWNCDAPFPIVYVEGQIVTADGTPLSNVQVGVFPNGGTSGRYGTTDNEGFFAGKMPKGMELILRVGYHGEDCAFASVNLGSFDVDTNVGQITLEETGDAFTVTGSIVDCMNNPLTNGLVKITVGNTRTEYILLEDNTFSIGLLNCDNVSDVSITVVDIDNLAESNVTTLPITSNVDFGIQQACGSALTEFFTLTVDGKTSNIVNNLTALFEIPETAEYLFMSLGSEPDSTETNNFAFNLSMESGSVGTYNKDDIYNLSISITEPNYNSNSNLYCQGCVELTSFEFNITENSGVNGYLGGDFSGTAIFTDADDQGMDTYPFSGEFRMPIQ